METPRTGTSVVMAALLVLLAGAIPAFSQGFSVGVKAGLNIARQRMVSPRYGTDDFSNFRIGINVSMFATHMFTRNVGIQAEVQYSGEGGVIDDNTMERLKLDYVNIPVLFRFQPVPMFHLEAGPQFGALVSAAQDGHSVKSSMKGNEAALVLGGGIDFGNGIGIGFRLVDGVTDTNRETADLHNRNFTTQFTIGYRFRRK